MFWQKAKPLPIGLDLGHDTVKVVQLAHTLDGPKVLAAAKESIADESRLASDRRPASIDAARQLIASHGFQGRKVTACLPRELVHLKTIRLPMMPVTEVTGAVAFEAANAFGFDLANASLKHIVAGEIRHGSESRLEVMCLAVQNSDIDEFVEQIHRSGLELAGLEFEAASLFSGLNRFVSSSPANYATLILDVGYRRSQVVIGRSGDLQFFKPIDIGSRRLVTSVARKLGITEKEASALRLQLDSADGNASIDQSVSNAVEDATRQTITELAREVALCLRYFSVTFRGVRVKEMRIVGGESNCKLLRHLLESELPVATKDWSHLEFINGATSPLQLAPWALPTALAARDLPFNEILVAKENIESWDSSQGEVEVVRD